ncbi:single-stranded DNA-binding protein [Subtercola endophyticus]|uniref:single-stranded DNA-binding protein n=1 Tax=Subtercola endophyticus TaxID=2895559 RepID=UPI001E42EA10|nr:single-stranded DNA-binding protein [Subtercola endophyticus]UFS60894.1 single-stranded DNA-binding protein [Subtercola endophyticus]
MPDNISLTGVVATDPRHITTNDGLDITSFRLASSQRRFDRAKNSWVDAGTNWYTVTAFRQLAANMAVSLNKGDRVVASGRVRLREWSSAEKNGMTIEVEAEAVGHDLSWGSASFSKSIASSRGAGGAGFEPAGGAAPAESWAVPPAPAQGGDWGAPAPATATEHSGDGFLPDDERSGDESGGTESAAVAF